ncbi:MAG TPA: YihY/virulence factor BrkB family protein [Acidimicrobiales bacterium]|nr:YihY/virulence factor BrkB family protein [Acidimicrobiales bacterium]
MNPVERVVRRVDRFQQTHRPLAFGFGVIKKFGDDRAGSLAALIAYYAFLGIFPLLLLLTTILGFAMESNRALRDAVLRSALRDFPIVGQQLGSAINPLQGSRFALTAGFVVLVWGSLGITQAGQLAMAEVWNVPGVDRPPFVSRMLRGFGLLGVLGIGLVATTAIGSLSTSGDGMAVKVAGIVLSVALNIGLFVLAFRVLTPRTVRTGLLLPGAILGGICWSLLQLLGAYLVGHQLRYASQVYGYFASVLGLVSWLFLGAQVTLYAAEANVVWARRLWPRSIVQPPLTDADKRAFDNIALQGERRPEQSVVSTWDDDVVDASQSDP